MHPNTQFPDTNFWRKAASIVPWINVFSDSAVKLKIGTFHRVGTPGSFFAQRISTSINDSGFNFVDYELNHPLLNKDIAND